MTDLMAGQPAWTKLFREKGAFFKRIIYLRDAVRRFRLRPTGTQLVVTGDIAAAAAGARSFTNMRFTGTGSIVPPTNIDEPMVWYMRITDAAGTATYSVYRATGGGGGDLVAEGAALPDSSADQILAEQNASGVSFLIDTGVPVASDAGDTIIIYAFPDFPLWDHLFDGSEADHKFLIQEWQNSNESIAGTLDGALSAAVTSWGEFLRTRWATFNRASDPDNENFINKEVDDTDGVITTRFTGLLEQGRDNMADETVPAAQTIVENVFSAGAGVPDNDNQGLGAILAPTMEEWTQDGLMTLVCNDATIGRERFGVSLRRDDTGEVIAAISEMTVKKQWADPIIGVRSLLLSRTVTLDAGVAADFTIAGFSIDGETAFNTSDGQLFMVIEENPTPGTFRINFYTSAAATPATQVATTDYGAANAVVNIQAIGSNLSGVAQLGSAPTDANTGTFNFNPFRTQNSNGVPDKFTIDVTVTSRGRFQRVLADQIQYALNSAASGAETLPDDFASAGALFPYEVADA